MSLKLAAIRSRNAAVQYADRVACVVGGTSGIGEGIAVRLARAGMRVLVVGRSVERGQRVVARLAAVGGSGHRFIPCDVSLLTNVAACTHSLRSEADALHVLVLSSGIASLNGRTETREGVDEKLAVHYYSRMAFIAGTLPLLRAVLASSQPARVLSVLSAGVHAPYAHVLHDPELKQHYSLKNAANAAGFYNDLCLDALARDAANGRISFIHAAPGFVNTRWGSELPWLGRAMVRLLQPLGRSPEDCAEAMCDPLLRPDAAPGLMLMNENAEPLPLCKGHTEDVRQFVWAHTQDVLRRNGVA